MCPWKMTLSVKMRTTLSLPSTTKNLIASAPDVRNARPRAVYATERTKPVRKNVFVEPIVQTSVRYLKIRQVLNKYILSE